MSEPQLILDYASPRKRGKVRLPANSVLAVTHERDGSVRVAESLAGRHGIMFPIAFGLFVACVAGYATFRETHWILHHRHKPIDFAIPVMMAMFGLVELLLTALVIRNTWRRTTLTANAERVTLEFAGPLMRTWRREWPTADVGAVVLTPTQSESDAVRLAELQLRPPGLLVNLFTDHRAMELEAITRKLDRAMAGEPPEVEPLRSQPVIEPEIPPPDPQTFQRLRETREGLRDRLH